MYIGKLLGNRQAAAWLLRIGLATVFLYAAVDSFIHPEDWVGYLPEMVRDQISPDILLKIFSVYEIGLAAWLLSGIYMRWAALVCAATLAGIVASSLQLFAVTFRGGR